MAGSPPRRAAWRSRWRASPRPGIGADVVAEFFRDALISPVLTAHPTEVQRKSILDASCEIARLLAERDRVELTPEERRRERGVAAPRHPDAVADAHPARAAADRAATRSRTGCPSTATPSCASCRACTPRSRITLERAMAASRIPVGPILRMGAGSAATATAIPCHARRNALRAVRQSSTALDFYLTKCTSSARAVAVAAHGERDAGARSAGGALAGPVRPSARRALPARADRHLRPAGRDFARRWTSMRRERQEVAPAQPYADGAEFVRDLEMIGRSLERTGAARVARGRLRDLHTRRAGVRLPPCAAGPAPAQRRARAGGGGTVPRRRAPRRAIGHCLKTSAGAGCSRS